MKKLRYVGTLFFLMMTIACQKDIPEPETKDVSDVSLHSIEAVQASGYEIANEEPFFVRHQVKGKDVYIECIVKGVSFRNNGAKMILFIDGKKTKEVTNAAFIVKGLQSGTHQLKLELMKQNEREAIATKEIEVVIQ